MIGDHTPAPAAAAVEAAADAEARAVYLRPLADTLQPIATPNERWKKGTPHDHRSMALFERLAYFDFKFCNDYFCWKSGGDGDNGETLMYLLDMVFEERDRLSNICGFDECSGCPECV